MNYDNTEYDDMHSEYYYNYAEKMEREERGRRREEKETEREGQRGKERRCVCVFLKEREKVCV